VTVAAAIGAGTVQWLLSGAFRDLYRGGARPAGAAAASGNREAG